MPFNIFYKQSSREHKLYDNQANFRNKHMRSIDIIRKLLYEDKKDDEYVAKWMRVLWKKIY